MNSKLQIISGRFHGRKLYLSDDARPTQNRARAALFNVLTSGILEADGCYKVWDVFAGSGALGIEFLSRYPNSRVLFTDLSDKSVNAIRKNLSLLKIGNEARVINADGLNLVNKYAPEIDVAFVDAPYANSDVGVRFIESFANVAKKGSVIVWEQESTRFVSPTDNWTVLRDKTYGRARFLVLQLVNK